VQSSPAAPFLSGRISVRFSGTNQNPIHHPGTPVSPRCMRSISTTFLPVRSGWAGERIRLYHGRSSLSRIRAPNRGTVPRTNANRCLYRGRGLNNSALRTAKSVIVPKEQPELPCTSIRIMNDPFKNEELMNLPASNTRVPAQNFGLVLRKTYRSISAFPENQGRACRPVVIPRPFLLNDQSTISL
jgi:hypothetical protein